MKARNILESSASSFRGSSIGGNGRSAVTGDVKFKLHVGEKSCSRVGKKRCKRVPSSGSVSLIHSSSTTSIKIPKLNSSAMLKSFCFFFNGLSKDGLTHEALELFSQIKDKGQMPDVVAHTAVIEAYANAGKAKEALKAYLRMLASGVLPNAYTYTVLIKSLAGSGDMKLLGEARKYFIEMMGKKVRPNAGTCVSVFEGFVKGGKEEEGRELVKEMKARGFAPDEKGVREVLRDKRGPVFRSIMNIFFSK